VSAPAKSRAHLVERAFQAMGGAAAAGLRRDLSDLPGQADPAGPAAAPAALAPAARDALAPAAPAAPAPAAPAAPGPAPAMRDAPLPRLGGAEVADRPAGAAQGALPPAPVTAGATPPPTGPEKPTPPTLDRMRAAGLVVAPTGGVRMRLAEEFSVVQQQLTRTIRTMDAPPEGSGRGRRVVLVTSARPGEGKTFCSLNIAASIAIGRSSPVLLVDADGKRGSLSELLGLADAPGLRMLSGQPGLAPEPMLVPTELRNLLILPYGRPAPGVEEVPHGATLAAAVQRLSALLPQHVIILDAPPCLSTSDPSSLAAVAGQVLLVVEAERTQRAEVEAALDMVEACPILQLMLNQTRLSSTDTFGAYGGYDVYGGYGSKAAPAKAEAGAKPAPAAKAAAAAKPEAGA
jgi:receptor protein-tyrosine kinase